MSDFEIAGRRIGEEYPPYVIAEVGLNHEGSLDTAISMVDAAAGAGADCVKIQTHITEQEMIKTGATPGELSTEALWDIVKRCELTADDEAHIQRRCREKGVQFLSTPFSPGGVDRLNAMGVDAFKVGSGDCNNHPLIEYIAKNGKPTIVSTGMNDLASIAKTVQIFIKNRCPLALMECTSIYPTPYEKVRLGAVRDLQRTFGLPVGLSDHSLGVYTCIGAVAVGACILEKHFTTSRSLPGPDTSISIEPSELKTLVEGAKAVWLARGGSKEILPEEQPVIDFAYTTVVTTRPVRTGEILSRENIWVKRPGTGHFKAEHYETLIGKAVVRDIAADKQVAPEDLSETTA